uniref:Reverse transcriptase zinc-binding domain-containing protein n=1 Tax=Chenopodium quinoa TaxID=63459 RepID=A0A803N9E7_CHEQI
MADELVDRYASLNISAEEEEVVDVGDIEIEDQEIRVSLLLIGRLLTDRGVNVDAFKRTITQSWALKGRVIIRNIGINLYAFQFLHWRDKEKVMSRRPWCFEQNLLIHNEIAGGEQPRDVDLNFSPFWIRLEDLPFNCRTDNHVRTIAGKMREVIEVEEDTIATSKSRRVKVLLDEHKPLRRYQNLLTREAISDDSNVNGHGWGAWLKASPMRGKTQEDLEVKEMKAAKKLNFIPKSRQHDNVKEMVANALKIPGALIECEEGSQIRVNVQGRNEDKEGRGDNLGGGLRIPVEEHGAIMEVNEAMEGDTKEVEEGETGRNEELWTRNVMNDMGSKDFDVSWLEKFNATNDLGNQVDSLMHFNAIPLVDIAVPNSLFWNLTSSGVYYVKSAYWMGLLGKRNVNIVINDRVWRGVWNLAGPPKLKQFLWRACTNTLVVGTELYRRHIRDTKTCQRCNNVDESIAHALFQCEKVKEIWVHCQIWEEVQAKLNEDFPETFANMLEGLSRDDLSLFSTLAWAAWTSRNKSLFEEATHDPQQLATQFVSLYEEWGLKFDYYKKQILITRCASDLKISLDYLPCFQGEKGGQGSIFSSCNGLLLCSNRFYGDREKETFYVCNPVTKQWQRFHLPLFPLYLYVFALLLVLYVIQTEEVLIAVATRTITRLGGFWEGLNYSPIPIITYQGKFHVQVGQSILVYDPYTCNLEADIDPSKENIFSGSPRPLVTCDYQADGSYKMHVDMEPPAKHKQVVGPMEGFSCCRGSLWTCQLRDKTGTLYLWRLEHGSNWSLVIKASLKCTTELANKCKAYGRVLTLHPNDPNMVYLSLSYQGLIVLWNLVIGTLQVVDQSAQKDFYSWADAFLFEVPAVPYSIPEFPSHQ